jgi:hypothetical protein
MSRLITIGSSNFGKYCGRLSDLLYLEKFSVTILFGNKENNIWISNTVYNVSEYPNYLYVYFINCKLKR